MWPSKRSFHAATSLVDPNYIFSPNNLPSTLGVKFAWLPCPVPDLSNPDGLFIDPKLLVLWGMDNNGDPVDDAWVLNVNNCTWEKVNTYFSILDTLGHN